MPRNSSGTYSLPIAAFVPGGLIKSADHNSNYSDIATALTQSLATTGVSSMTGPIKAAAGSLAAPAVTFTGALSTGLFLNGTNQIGWSSNGVLGATFNGDTSVTWAGGATWAGTVSANIGTMPVGSVMDFAGSTPPSGWYLCFGQLVSTTTYAALFAVLGTTYGSGSGTFGIPDYRGRAGFGQDNMGGSAANRITNANSGIVGTTQGAAGGSPNFTMITANLPPYTPSGTISGSLSMSGLVGTPSTTNAQAGGGSAAYIPSSSFIGNSGSFSGSFSGSAQGGTSTPVVTISPAIITNKIIFAGV